jgi:hypothetical protein
LYNQAAFNATSGDISTAIGNYNVATFTAAGSNVITSAFGSYNYAQTASNGTVSSIVGLQQYVRFAGTSNTCPSAYGIQSSVASDFGGGYASNMYGIASYASHDADVNIASLYSYYGGTNNASASNVTTSVGLFSYANNTSTGTVANQRGIYTYSLNSSSGIVTTSIGAYIETHNQGTGVLTNNYGVLISGAVNSGGGTISNNYGLYISAQTTGLVNYSIFSANGKTLLYNSDTALVGYAGNTFNTTFTPTADAAVTKCGFSNEVRFNATSGDIATALGMYNYNVFAATGSNAITSAVGFQNHVIASSTGTVSDLIGMRQYVRFETAANTCTTSYGIYVDSTASTGYADTQVGVKAFVSHQVNRAITGIFCGNFDTFAQSASNTGYSYALIGRAYNTAAGTVANQRGVSVETHNTSTGVVTTNIGINIASAVNSGGGTMSTNIFCGRADFLDRREHIDRSVHIAATHCDLHADGRRGGAEGWHVSADYVHGHRGRHHHRHWAEQRGAVHRSRLERDHCCKRNPQLLRDLLERNSQRNDRVAPTDAIQHGGQHVHSIVRYLRRFDGEHWIRGE